MIESCVIRVLGFISSSVSCEEGDARSLLRFFCDCYWINFSRIFGLILKWNFTNHQHRSHERAKRNSLYFVNRKTLTFFHVFNVTKEGNAC